MRFGRTMERSGRGWCGESKNGCEMIELVLVDFDDTLVETAPAFQHAREALFAFLEAEGFSRDVSHKVHYDEVDPELLAAHGMGPFRMAPSFRETYVRLCRKKGRNPDPKVAERCAGLGRDFLGRPKVMDGSLESLLALSEKIPTAIFSQAAQTQYQLERIREAGVTEIIPLDRVRIVERKTPVTFQEVVHSFGIHEPSHATMIGNSLRSDINPALAVGARAILVEPYEMWHYDNVPPIHEDFLRFPTFSEAVSYLTE